MYYGANGDYGTPVSLSAYEPMSSRGHVLSTSIYLPPPGSNLKDFFWKYYNDDECKVADEVDYRNETVVHVQTIGDTLEYCTNPWELCVCLLHAMLGTLPSLFS